MSLNIPAHEFLTTLDRLDDCLARTMTLKAQHEDGAAVRELGCELFGEGSWSLALYTAVQMEDRLLLKACRSFVNYCQRTVCAYGLCSWLYDMINDATIALYLHTPSERMSPMIRSLNSLQLKQRLTAKGMARYGSKRQREEDMGEHVVEMHRMASYILLRWGGGDAQAMQTARMLLNNPGYGMCMLKENTEVGKRACPDVRYRRVVDYLRKLRADADLEYARYLASPNAADSSGAETDNAGAENEDDQLDVMDERYLYDADRLIDAYEALWESDTVRASTAMERVERSREIPALPLFENPVYLRDLADSLMGSGFSSDLVLGFEKRNRERFDLGVGELRRFEDIVRRLGVEMLPVLIMRTYEEQEIPDRYVSSARYTKIARDYRGLVDDMVGVLLSRMEDDGQARDAAVCLFQHSIDTYCELLMQMHEDEKVVEETGELVTEELDTLSIQEACARAA